MLMKTLGSGIEGAIETTPPFPPTPPPPTEMIPFTGAKGFGVPPPFHASKIMESPEKVRPSAKKATALISSKGADIARLFSVSEPVEDIRIFESAEMLPPVNEKSPVQLSDTKVAMLDSCAPAQTAL